jgi:hypothetical protein
VLGCWHVWTKHVKGEQYFYIPVCNDIGHSEQSTAVCWTSPQGGIWATTANEVPVAAAQRGRSAETYSTNAESSQVCDIVYFMIAIQIYLKYMNISTWFLEDHREESAALNKISGGISFSLKMSLKLNVTITTWCEYSHRRASPCGFWLRWKFSLVTFQLMRNFCLLLASMAYPLALKMKQSVPPCSVDMILPTTVALTSDRNHPGSKGQPVCKADILTAICRTDFLENVRSLLSHSPMSYHILLQR